MKRKIGFLELKTLLGLTPGNLDHHLKQLEQNGFVRSKRIISWRPLVVIEITALGADAFRTYLLKMKTLLEDIPHGMLHDKEIQE